LNCNTALKENIASGDLLGSVLDVQGVPRRRFFVAISSFATNEEEREKLLELASDEGYDLYFDYVVQGKRNYLDIFEDFRSCRPPLQVWLATIPVMFPRRYSVASSSAVRSNQVCSLGKRHISSHLPLTMTVRTMRGCLQIKIQIRSNSGRNLLWLLGQAWLW
jgi:sulfite reductase alpha subunit-like flavoprotein